MQPTVSRIISQVARAVKNVVTENAGWVRSRPPAGQVVKPSGSGRDPKLELWATY